VDNIGQAKAQEEVKMNSIDEVKSSEEDSEESKSEEK